jgi:hypothetical protein
MTAHTHRPQDAYVLPAGAVVLVRGVRVGTTTEPSRLSLCISCGKAIQKVAEAPDRMAYWRTVR